MNRQEIFKKQQKLRMQLKNRPLLHEAATADKISEILNCEVDEGRLNSFNYAGDLNCPIEVNPNEVQTLISEIKNSFDNKRLEKLFDRTKNDIIHSIAGPFGLGRVVSAYDKIGGNVDTIHNVRKGVYATDKEYEAYSNQGDYASDTVHKHSNYTDQNRRNSIARKSIGLKDGYTCKILTAHDKVDLDHVISGKQTHDDAGRVLAEINTEELSNIDINLVPTHMSINRSKKAKSPDEYAEYLERTSVNRKARIGELSNEQNLNDKKRKELDKLNQLEITDPNIIRARGLKAKKAQDKILNKRYYCGEKFTVNTISTGVNEGTKAGRQQMFGVLLIEIFHSSFEEIQNAFRNGLEGDSLFDDIKMRQKRIIKRVSSKWKDAIDGFSDGFISGFISNIVTTIINAFVTTGKRVVRMIREGLFSLLKATKTVLFPPQGITFCEAAHEAMKLVASGSIVLAGVALEEVVEKLIMNVPLLTSIAPIITGVIVGSISAIGMALTCYLIDKIDPLGIINAERDQFVIESLDHDIRNTLSLISPIKT